MTFLISASIMLGAEEIDRRSTMFFVQVGDQRRESLKSRYGEGQHACCYNFGLLTEVLGLPLVLC